MKIGIALSGGGIRGIAHAGLLKALEDNGIKISVIGGTSSGSLVASLYSMGYSPYYIYITFKNYAKEIVQIKPMPVINTINGFINTKRGMPRGLKTGENLEKAYNRLASKKGIKNISDIKNMPLVIPAVDIGTGKEYIFTNNKIKKEKQEKNSEFLPDNENCYINDITVGKAVRASSSFPGVFSPCPYKKFEFLDGGILNNIPVEEVKKQGADIVIAVNFKSDDITNQSNIIDIAMRTLDIIGNKVTEKNLEKSDYTITIETGKTGLLDTEKIDECYQAGYQAGLDNIEKIKAIIKQK